jgi:tetratricopeptide (TPR) repeat protein
MAVRTLSPGQVLGHFRLIEQIGAGGMGIVYRARDERLERDVAVKVLNAKTLADVTGQARFRREALVLSRLNHPNVEAVYDFHSEQGLDYLVLEYVPGVSLDDRLQNGPVAENEVFSLGVQLARGLAAAHARGVLHRDLKPGNLRVTPERVLKILDFGLAQLFGVPDEKTLTDAEMVTMEAPSSGGTPPYMAPEQLEHKEPDVRSDIYSAGAALYEMATGSRPFPQHGQMLWEAILHSLPLAPRTLNQDISPELEAIILKCLDKDPNLRYQSAGELLGDLKRLRPGQTVTESFQDSAVAQLAAKSWNRRTGISLAAILLLGIAIGTAIWKWPRTQQVRQKIMAVLPIDTVGQDPATSALGLGLTETVTAKLVQASDSDAIQVVSPRDLRDQGVKTAADARREFGTDLVLESSLQRSGQTIRINCYLVDSKTHQQLAAKAIEAQVTDAFGLQDRIVSAALDMLPAQIKPEQRRKLNVSQDTQPAAYEVYIRGLGYLQELNKPEDIDNAIAEFTQAIKIDPKYALGYAALGKAYWVGFHQFAKGNEWIAKASGNCEKALSLNPDLAEGHICLGKVFNGTGKYDKAVEEFQRAVKSEPGSEDALRGFADAYMNLGNFAAAEATYKQAIALRPNYWAVYSWLGAFYDAQARYSEAAEMFRKATELAPDNYLGYSNLGGTYILQGRYADAIQALERSVALRPNTEAYGNLGYAYFLMHRFADAVTTLETVKPADREWQNWGNLADALYWAPGRRAEASRAYQTAISLALSKLEINPQAADILAYLADYYAMMEDRPSAFSYLRRALKGAPSDPEVLFRASLVYNHFSETEQALAVMEKAVAAHYSRTVIRDTPDFQPLQRNARFRALVSGS